MDRETAKSISNILNEIVEEAISLKNQSDKSENITLSELYHENERSLRNQEKLYNLYSKYPELGDANKVKPDGSFFEKALSVYGQRHMKSLSEDLKRYQKNHEEYKQQNRISATKQALYEILEETKTSSTNLLQQIKLKDNTATDNTKQLKVNQIALIHVYEGIQITRENAVEIAADYGYTSKTSGEGLFQDYSFFISPANRKGKPIPCTPKKLQNKIKLLESIIEILTDPASQRAKDEIKILTAIFDNEYQ